MKKSYVCSKIDSTCSICKLFDSGLKANYFFFHSISRDFFQLSDFNECLEIVFYLQTRRHSCIVSPDEKKLLLVPDVI
jgi:hypothetical protein